MSKNLKLLLLALLIVKISKGQQISLKDLSAFKNPPSHWQLIGIAGGLYNADALTTEPGLGILHCGKKVNHSPNDDLFTSFEHGDINLSFDFMVPKSSNSGVYFMGQYELQIFDSWGAKNLQPKDLGSIYERWDETRGKGNEGYEGHPASQNVSFAPGLWQHFDVEFRAPKFNEKGEKTENAYFKKVILNGVVIHENIELLGPTRGHAYPKEIAKGPLRFQGDHGEVVFKNFKVELLDNEPATIQNISYQYFEGKFEKIPETMPAKTKSTGKLDKINYRVAEKNDGFLIAFEGEIVVPKSADYTLSLPATGITKMELNGKVVLPDQGHKWRGETNEFTQYLAKGKHNFKVYYVRSFPWGGRALGLFIKRDGAEVQPLHQYNSFPDPEPKGLIALKSNENKAKIQRSFLMHKGRKITHAIHIGSPAQVHFSYNIDKASLLQIWKGNYLNTTEMWYERGEPQTAEAMGAALILEDKNSIFKASDTQMMVDSLSVENEFVYKGYTLQEGGLPLFSYNYQGKEIKDFITPNDEGTGLLRRINLGAENSGLTVRLATGQSIKPLSNGLYLVDNIYVKTDTADAVSIVKQNGKSILLAKPTNKKIEFQIIW